MLDRRTDEFGADPIFGVQSSLGVYVPKLAVPDAEVAEAMVGKFEGVGGYFHDLAERHREGVAPGRTPADFAVRQTVDQLDRWLATPIDQDPMLAVQDPPAGRRRGPLARAAGGRGAASRCGRRSSTTATCSATRSRRTPAPTSGAG